MEMEFKSNADFLDFVRSFKGKFFLTVNVHEQDHYLPVGLETFESMAVKFSHVSTSFGFSVVGTSFYADPRNGEF
uniref:Uncharacterized protein n=1 Tax=Rhizobium phage LG08 TaxID=3129229 RepID=A0AAU8HY34_9CAUD